MKKTILALTLLISVPALAEDAATIKDGVKGFVSGLVSTGKDTLSGVKSGIDDGRKTGESVDSATIITEKEGLNKFIEASVLSATKVGEKESKEYEVTLALRNKSDKPVRLTNLNEANSLVLLDASGFASLLKTSLSPSAAEVMVPASAAVKVRYTFTNVEDAPALLRLYGVNITVPQADKK
ncbi:hypothetical protein [Serratia sp. DD3]|uniref:hypothetical protein n=1 Tax=Serratia sp. DD3 TaxID=1410619 RepID=UPI0003C52BB9|nr:hypothetical protein [Serratia sp. DD3]KEY57393.1 hypothetical protein SRDD_36350 [Serratia sp. DD3]